MTDNPITDGNGENDRRERRSEFTYDVGTDESPSHAVVNAVAAYTNRSPIDLDPLYDVVDPDHLDGLFGKRGPESSRAGGSFVLLFGGCEVTVTRDEIRVREADDGR
ncbi:HalOD1 output domain-containing protein [Halomicrococcus sp. NG-SE-24]|uniref:HalOD1 output domain-containing protein n=1 Tax=Halomicrococcus sp. NG-SE-24 TaxID=3436928 RepID=UPI003D959860